MKQLQQRFFGTVRKQPHVITVLHVVQVYEAQRM
jgi:hypothetical protein